MFILGCVYTPSSSWWVCLFCIIHQCLGFINQPRHLEKYWGFDYSSVSSTTCQFRRDSDKRYLFRDLRFTMTTPDHRHQGDGVRKGVVLCPRLVPRTPTTVVCDIASITTHLQRNGTKKRLNGRDPLLLLSTVFLSPLS